MKMGKTIENSTDNHSQNAEKNKKKKKKSSVGKIKRWKKKQRPSDAPKHPLTGYIRFMNVRREELRKIHPTFTAIDITKLIGEEWNHLGEEERKPYLEAAEVDKERYNREWIAYVANKKSDESSSETTEAPLPKTNGIDEKTKDSTTPSTAIAAAAAPATVTVQVQNNNHQTTSKLPQSGDYDVPIFTDEFLEHNKIMDTRLRTLRKSNTDYEQQNSILEKHVENMNTGIDKLTNELNDLKSNHVVLHFYLTNLKKKLANALSGLAIPSEPNGANFGNIDKYMADLLRMATSNSHGPASLNKAKDIIRKLDLQIQSPSVTT